MKLWLVPWKLFPAYGDPEGNELVEAETSIDAYNQVKAHARTLTIQGEFYATPIDVTHLRAWIEEIQQWTPAEFEVYRTLMQAVKK